MESHKFNVQRLLSLIEQKKITKKQFCKDVSLSPTTLANMQTREDYEIGSNRLVAIADYFNVSLDYFFDRENMNVNFGHTVTGNDNCVSGNIMVSQYATQIEHLTELLNEKERTIQILLNK